MVIRLEKCKLGSSQKTIISLSIWLGVIEKFRVEQEGLRCVAAGLLFFRDSKARGRLAKLREQAQIPA